MTPIAEALTITVDDRNIVSGLLLAPPGARALYVLAHGAGAGMRHAFMEAVASDLAERGIGTLRYQFPYMDHGSRRPDAPPLAHATVRAAVNEAARRCDLPLFAGGKSFGGRMTSQAQAASPLAGVRRLIFLGFPLHPAGKPGQDRAKHLFDIEIPMLFLQGTADKLAELDQFVPVVDRLGDRATLKLFEHADHSFHVPARTGRRDPEVRAEMLDALVQWVERVVSEG